MYLRLRWLKNCLENWLRFGRLAVA